MTTIDPGEGWRFLVVGELIRDDDQCYRPDLKEGPWIQIRTEMGRQYNTYDHYPIRRKIDAKANIASVKVHTGSPYIAIEVHRAALAEIERLKAELDAIKHPQPDPEPEWFDLTPFGEHVLRRDIDWVKFDGFQHFRRCFSYFGTTIEHARHGIRDQFRCLLRDAPPQLVAKAKQCVMCGTRNVVPGTDGCLDCTRYAIEATGCPIESPDDWVTQDRVPYRKGVDEFRWERVNGTFVGPWSNLETNPRMHGYVDGLNDRFQVRCRRRDLPPMPDKPKTEREVSLYWYDGNVVGRYADCPPTDPSFIPLIVRDGKVFVETETREVVR